MIKREVANLNQTIIQSVSEALQDYSKHQIQAVIKMLEDGNTIPFIARYRKELTGNLEEVAIHAIQETYQMQEKVAERKEEILRLIDAQGKLTAALKQQIMRAEKLQTLEDLYRPYKQKRRTKAMIAKENGLEPLAARIWEQKGKEAINVVAQKLLSEKVLTIAEALLGAQEILAEQISDNAQFRSYIREKTEAKGQIVSSRKKEADDPQKTFEMYYEFESPFKKMVPYRTLALNRGEKEKILKVAIAFPNEEIERYLEWRLIHTKEPQNVELMQAAIESGLKRFLLPSIERELRQQLSASAEIQAIHVFGENLRSLLLQPPLKGKRVLGFDPAYRTGCKLAVVDATGKLLAVSVIYPHKPAPEKKRSEASPLFEKLIEKYQVDIVAIGNGTASRESEQFVSEVLKTLSRKVYYTIVSEAGASVYSASEVARSEFPDLHVEERSAVSIARRLQDPLAELVKIDPQAVGVGQYQHDVSQKLLKDQLAFVVETAVNQVGIDLNTASIQLLQFVSGLNKTIAENIVTFREENGAFESRPQLKKVPRLGPKAYEQAAGFLRIPEGKNLFDNTNIHPESYALAKDILDLAGVKKQTLGTPEATSTLKLLDPQELAVRLEAGEATIKDIIQSLIQPGRDPREDLPPVLLRSDVLKIEDLKPGMKMSGTVRNVVDFGAFVDIGVKEDGLVHVSHLSKRFVKNPLDVVSVGQIVDVWVLSVDIEKSRIGLSMVDPAAKEIKH